MSDPGTIVIVGNGPVEGDHGEIIDTADVVIRMNRFRLKGFERKVGSRIDIYAVYPKYCLRNWDESDLANTQGVLNEIWFVRPHEWAAMCPQHLTFIEQKPLYNRYYMPDELWVQVITELGDVELIDTPQDKLRTWVLDSSSRSKIGPSTGYSTIAMTINRFRNSQIRVVGLTGNAGSGWYWGPNPTYSTRHPWEWEELQIRSMALAGSIECLL